MPPSPPERTRVGVLALQGAFALHRRVLERLGAAVTEVRVPRDLDDLEAVVLPGGESTTMSMLLESAGLWGPLGERLRAGLPVLGTCAGLILCARSITDGRADQRSFGVLDVTVRRNAWGPQVDSFECPVDITGWDRPFPGVFIRAPRITGTGPGVEVLATVDGSPVLVRQGTAAATAFHPELTDDDRIHRWFLDTVVGSGSPTVASGPA